MINNKITKIQFSTTTENFCPLGKDFYTTKFEVSFSPNGNIPDYCEIENLIVANIDGKEVIIEDAATIMSEIIIKVCDTATDILIKASTDNAESHFPVMVEVRL